MLSKLQQSLSPKVPSLDGIASMALPDRVAFVLRPDSAFFASLVLVKQFTA